MKGVSPKIPPAVAITLRKFLRSFDGGASTDSSGTEFSEAEDCDSS